MSSSSPSKHARLRVRKQEWEVEPAVANLYRGIFSVSVEEIIDVAFIPRIVSPPESWSRQKVRENIDLIETAEEARIIALLFSEYSVIPGEHCGSEYVFPYMFDDGDTVTRSVFYVSDAEYKVYERELERTSREAGGVQFERHLAEFAENSFIKTVVEIVQSRRQPGVGSL